MEMGDLKIGFIGIIEKDWTVTFKNLEALDEYQNYKRSTTTYINQLRNDYQCNLIVALCHMRLHHDVKLA